MSKYKVTSNPKHGLRRAGIVMRLEPAAMQKVSAVRESQARISCFTCPPHKRNDVTGERQLLMPLTASRSQQWTGQPVLTLFSGTEHALCHQADRRTCESVS